MERNEIFCNEKNIKILYGLKERWNNSKLGMLPKMIKTRDKFNYEVTTMVDSAINMLASNVSTVDHEWNRIADLYLRKAAGLVDAIHRYKKSL